MKKQIRSFISTVKRLYKRKKQYSITKILLFGIIKFIPIIATELLANILVDRFIG
jgi:hypothetical protein